jgi:hemolysin activation/secretion protein
VIDAPTAAAASAEVYWPLANLQAGYKSLPLFLHRLKLGTFVDAGYASGNSRTDDFLMGAGFELLTSLELGWGNLSTFRIGVAWPLVQPGDLNQEGPVFVFQLGRPL